MFWHILGVYLVFLFAHLFLCPSNSEHMSNIPTLPSAVSDPSFPSPSLGLPSATPSPSLGLPSAATPPSSTAPTAVSRVESSGQRSLPPHLGYSQNKDVPSPAALTVRRNLCCWVYCLWKLCLIPKKKGKMMKLRLWSFLLHRMATAVWRCRAHRTVSTLSIVSSSELHWSGQWNTI